MKENAQKIDYTEEGEIIEYVGRMMVCNWAERLLKMTQLVPIWSFENEFEIPAGHHFATPTAAESILMKYDPQLQVIIWKTVIFDN